MKNKDRRKLKIAAVVLGLLTAVYFLLKNRVSMLMGSKEYAQKIIKDFEGFREDLHNGFVRAYYDGGHVPTIGWGTTFYADGSAVSITDVVSLQTCIDAFNHEFNEKYNSIKSNSKVPLSNNQVAALTSFAYNVGLTALYNSTLWHLLQSGADKQTVAAQFDRWVYDNHEYVPGLASRRAKEKTIFLT